MIGMRNSFRVWLDGLILAFQLLTIVPLSKQVQWDEARAKASVASYPLVGFALASLLSAQWLLLANVTFISPLVAALWLLTFSAFFSGGLHLDGWTDFHDAVFSRRSREHKLDIMKDPQVGTFGVLALLLLLGWRFVFIFELFRLAPQTVLLAVFLIPILVRLLLGWQLLLGRFAREDGMAAALKSAKTKGNIAIYSLWTIVLLGFLLFVSPIYLLLPGAAFLFLVVWQKWVVYQLGGITGDTVGAGAEGGKRCYGESFGCYSY